MLSQTAEYALRAVSCLANAVGQSLSADKIAEQTKVPRRYLTRVLQELARHEVVHSKSGPGGGYELKTSPAALTILDIVAAVSPIERIESCPLGIESHTQLCPLHAELDRAYARIEEAFAGVTIQDLLDSQGSRTPLCSS